MKNTERRRNQVIKYATLYCQRLGIETIPRFTLDMKEYRQFIKVELGEERMPRLKHNLGRCFRKNNTIWVNLARHKNAVDLRHTISHELVHIAYPSLPHGTRFDKITMSVISGTITEKKI